jgi:enoyl-CoA hydratase/carnithine racemase
MAATDATYEQVEHRLQGEVATITLNRPDAGNRLSNAMAASVGAALAASATSRVILLRGAGTDFCAGRDMQPPVSGARVSPADVLRDDTQPMLELFDAFRRCRQPVLAVVRGKAWGIGTVFAALADVTYAAQGASFRLGELERGIPPAIALSALIDRMPPKALAHLVYSAEAVDAAAAQAAGLVSRVLAAAELESAVDAFVARLLGFAPGTVEAVKQYLGSAPRFDPANAALYGSSLLANILAGR